jgi:hypothetical protein
VRENLKWQGEIMSTLNKRMIGTATLLIAMFPAIVITRASAQNANPAAGNLDPKVLSYKLPDQIEWKHDPVGADMAVLQGDPSKPGLYIVLVKWTPHHMSHPHWHPNVRYITVISGTWWVGTGPKFDPEKTVAIPAGSYVTHFAKQIHYDGAKDTEAVLEIVGEGPATATPAEEK